MTRMPHSADLALDYLSDSHPALALLPVIATAEQIEAFGQYLQSLEKPGAPLDISTMVHRAEALYGRSVVIKRGTYLIGLPHKLSGIAVSLGDITVWEADTPRKRFTGPHIIETKPGGYRIGFAHADTTWLTVHANKTGSDDEHVIEGSLVEHAERLSTRRFTVNHAEALQ